MKKLVSVICILSTILVSSFANSIFTNRWFEVFADVNLDVSNNFMTLEDIFFTENGQILIDLYDFKTMPEKGFALDVNVNPDAGFMLNIPKGLILGVKGGAEGSLNTLLSKDFFDLFSVGYTTGDELKLQAKKFNADVFAFVQADIGWNLKKSSFVVKPSVFLPVVHAAPDDVSAVFKNTEDGKFIVNAQANFSIFTNETFVRNGNIVTDTLVSEMQTSLGSVMGLDLGFDYSWDIFKFLTVGAGVRFPIVPGRLTKKTSMTYSLDYEISAADYLDKIGKSEETTAESGDDTSSTDQGEDGQNPETPNFKPTFTDTVDLGTDYYMINRPLKFYVNANLHPSDFIAAYGQLGFTAKHAFEPSLRTSEIAGNFSMDYLLGARVSLVGMINLDISTEHTDQIYAHKAVLGLNLRLVEVDAGVSLASSSFLKSFAATGIGVFANVAVGL